MSMTDSLRGFILLILQTTYGVYCGFILYTAVVYTVYCRCLYCILQLFILYTAVVYTIYCNCLYCILQLLYMLLAFLAAKSTNRQQAGHITATCLKAATARRARPSCRPMVWPIWGWVGQGLGWGSRCHLWPHIDPCGPSHHLKDSLTHMYTHGPLFSDSH